MPYNLPRHSRDGGPPAEPSALLVGHRDLVVHWCWLLGMQLRTPDPSDLSSSGC